MRRAMVGVLVMTAGGCLAAPATERGTPLYTAAAPMPSREVATLDFLQPGVGWRGTPLIKSVDGRDVTALAAPFELLPGCHVVETAPLLPSGKNPAALNPAPNVFPLQMRAGHEYTVYYAWRTSAAIVGVVTFHTRDRDPVSGQMVDIDAATDADVVQACRPASAPPS